MKINWSLGLRGPPAGFARLSDRGDPGQSRQFFQQLHVFEQEIAHNIAEIAALLLRDPLQTFLQLAVKVDRQTHARSLPVKFASLRLGKVVMWLHCSSPLILCGFSPVRPARGDQAYLRTRLPAGFHLLPERVAHHQQHSSAIQSESDPTLLFLAMLIVEYRHGSGIEKDRGGPLK